MVLCYVKAKDSHSLPLFFTSIIGVMCAQIVSVSTYGRILPPTLRCSNESRDVNACLHKYMETDFMELSRIIFRKYDGNKDDCRAFAPKRQRVRDGRDGKIFEEGTSPVFVENCQKLHGIYNCLEEELSQCDDIHGFFNLRHLLYSVKKIIHWLCGKPIDPGSQTGDDNTHDEIKSRFLVLLHSAQCLECFRTSTSKASPCRQSSRSNVNPEENQLIQGSHLWLQILRLQVGPEVCSQLKLQFQCFQDEQLEAACDIENNVHRNVSELFMETWCDQHPFLPPPNSSAVPHKLHKLPTILFSFSSQGQSLALVSFLISLLINNFLLV